MQARRHTHTHTHTNLQPRKLYPEKLSFRLEEQIEFNRQAIANRVHHHWEIDGETVEIASDFIFGGSKITADGDCSHEVKRLLLLGRKAMTNLDSILKSRDVILLIQVQLVKTMVFPVVMYRCKSCTIKKAEL